MKYKVKNTVTGEETICEKVVADGEDYYVTKGKIPNESYYVSLENGFYIEPKERYVLYVNWSGLNGKNPKKIIATTNKSLDLPMVIDEVK